MTTNSFFPNLSSVNEQSLLASLNREAIQLAGLDVLYIPRTIVSKDDILNEDQVSTFNAAIPIEMYIKSAEGFEGEGDLLSKFGVEIRDQITLTFSKSRFQDVVVANAAFTHSRPMEGDCIYFPLNGKVFQIQHVEHEYPFYQLGKQYVYDIKVELFEYSNERFQTGNTTIDTLFTRTDTVDARTNLETYDALADNETIQTESDSILDFTESDPWSTGGSF